MKTIEQKYYTPPYPLAPEIMLIIVDTQLRLNNTQTKCVVKLPKNDQNTYPQLDGLECYDHKQILEVLRGEEWQYIEEF